MNRKLSTGRKTGFLLSALLLCFVISGTLFICESLKDKPLLADLCSAEGYHLYVEGKLVGAALTEDKAKSTLEELKKEYTGDGSQIIQASFVEDIRIKKGLVRPVDLISQEGIPVDLLDQVRPHVTVATIEVALDQEPLPFGITYEKTFDLPRGEEQVKENGVPGLQEVRREIMKLNGEIQSEEIVDQVLLEEPQDQVILIGAQPPSVIMASRGTSRTAGTNGSASGMVDFAMEYIGVPYLYGGSTPKGFDCSGFTKYVMDHFGVSLPRSSSGQFAVGVSVSLSELQTGDLVFYTASATSSRISHVGLYIGGGQFIHATQPGDTVRVSNLSDSWRVDKYAGARRVL